MDKAEIRVSGFEQFALSMVRFSKDFRDQVQKSVRQGTILITNRAKQNLAGDFSPSPKRHWITGNLARSVKGEAQWVGTNICEGRVGTAVDYAPKIEALPDGGFLYQAKAKTIGDVVELIKDEVGDFMKVL